MKSIALFKDGKPDVQKIALGLEHAVADEFANGTEGYFCNHLRAFVGLPLIHTTIKGPEWINKSLRDKVCILLGKTITELPFNHGERDNQWAARHLYESTNLK